MYRFKFLSLIIILIIFLSCVTFRNDFKQVRPSKYRFSIKKCSDSLVFNKIDTSAIYISVKKDNNTGLKFYGENKIAFFDSINLNNISTLNPKLASMGYYSTCNNINLIQFSFYNYHSGTYISKSEFKINNDTLVNYSLPSPQGGNFYMKYIKVQLKNDDLIYKPDW